MSGAVIETFVTSDTKYKSCDGVTFASDPQQIASVQSADNFLNQGFVFHKDSIGNIAYVLVLEDNITPNQLTNYRLAVWNYYNKLYEDCQEQFSKFPNGGWYKCDFRTDKVAILSKTALHSVSFAEVMLFTEQNALFSAKTQVLTFQDSMFALSLTQNVNVFMTTQQNSYCIKSQTTIGEISYTVTLRYPLRIRGVFLLGSSDASWKPYQKNIQVTIRNYSTGDQNVCGTITDYDNYAEVNCQQKVGDQIIISKQANNEFLGLCSVGIITLHDCSRTFYLPFGSNSDSFFPKNGKLLSQPSLTNGQRVCTQVWPDSESIAQDKPVCENLHYIYDDQNNLITLPYQGINLQPDQFRTVCFHVVGPVYEERTFTIRVRQVLPYTSFTQNNFIEDFLAVNIKPTACTQPTGLLNNQAIVQISSTTSRGGYDPTKTCDQDIGSFNLAYDGRPSKIFYHLLQPQLIQTIYLIGQDLNTTKTFLNAEISVGNDSLDLTKNVVCVAKGQVQHWGYFTCSLIGKILGVTTSDNGFFGISEINAYTLDAIQSIAKEATFFNNEKQGYPATNALTNSIVFDWFIDTQNKCFASNSVFNPKFQMTWPDDLIVHFQSFIFVAPALTQSSTLDQGQNNADVEIELLNGQIFSCGQMVPKNKKNYMLGCEKTGRKLIVQKKNTFDSLALCSIGVIGRVQNCDCKISKFLVGKILSKNNLSFKSGDAAVVVNVSSNFEDTKSKECGESGSTFCGPRIVTFTDQSEGKILQWPFKCFDWDPALSQLSVKPSDQCPGTTVLTVQVELKNFPLVQFSEMLQINVDVIPQKAVVKPDPCTSSSISFNVQGSQYHQIKLNQFLDQPLTVQIPNVTDSYTQMIGSPVCGSYQYSIISLPGTSQLVTLKSNELVFNTNVPGNFLNPVQFKILAQFKNYKNQIAAIIEYDYIYVQCKVQKFSPAQQSTDIALILDNQVQKIKISPFVQSPNCRYEITGYLVNGQTTLLQKIPVATDKELQLASNDTSISDQSDIFISLTPLFEPDLPVEQIEPMFVKITVVKPTSQNRDQQGKLPVIVDLDANLLAEFSNTQNLDNSQFNQRTKNNTKNDTEAAVMKIKSISDQGLLKIEFSKPVFPLKNPQILFSKLKIKSKQLAETQLLDLQIVPDPLNPNLYDYNFTVLNMTETELIIKINFSQPLSVSQSSQEDQLFLNFWYTKAIITKTNGLPIKLETEPSWIKIPRQMSGIQIEVSFIDGAQKTQFFVNQIIIASTILQFFVNLSANVVLAQIMGLSLICHVTCIQLQFPAIVSSYMATILNFVTFDVFGDYMPAIYDFLIGPDTTEPVSVNFSVTGYSSRVFIRNLGSIFVIQMGGLLLATLLRLCVKKKNSRNQKSCRCPNPARKYVKKYVQNTFWNSTLGFFGQNYMLISVSSLINFINTDYSESKWITYNNLVSTIVLFLVLVLPPYLFTLTIFGYEDLKNPNSDRAQMWGYNLDGIKMQRDLKDILKFTKPLKFLEQHNPYTFFQHQHHGISKRVTIVAGYIDYPRQLSFALTLIYLGDRIWAQILVCNVITLVYLIFIAYYRPYCDENLNNSIVVGEVVTLIYITLSRCYTDWVTDSQTRQIVGYAQVTTVTLYIFLVVIQLLCQMLPHQNKIRYQIRFFYRKYQPLVDKMFAKIRGEKQIDQKKPEIKKKTKVKIRESHDSLILSEIPMVSQDDQLLEQKFVQPKYYSKEAKRKMIERLEPPKLDMILVNPGVNLIFQDFPRNLTPEQIIIWIRTTFNLTCKYQNYYSFEQVKIIAQGELQELEMISISNFNDAEQTLQTIREQNWPFGLSHLLSQHVELDPFDLTFMRYLPQEYQDLSQDQRARLIINNILQQLYQLNDFTLNQKHQEVVDDLEYRPAYNICQMYDKIKSDRIQIEIFQRNYMSQHGQRLEIINSNLESWPYSRLEQFAIQLNKFRHTITYKTEIHRSFLIQMELLSLIQQLN